MELKKEKWLKKDIKEFEEYLKSLQNKEKQKWTQNIVRSNLKVLAIKNPILKQLANEIYKGNYESFLNYNLNNYYEEVLINAFIINKIKEPKLKIKYLEEYKKNEMCWATCDALKFDNNIEEAQTIDISKRSNKEMSVLKYIYNNTLYWEENSSVKLLMEFVNNMLWFRSLRSNEFMGVMANREDMNDFIINNRLLSKFEHFLKECGQDYKLCEINEVGRKIIGVKYKNYTARFDVVASTGTESLWLFFYWMNRTTNISFVFLDEFDAFYHYELSTFILNYINNKTEFQSVLTSHNTYLINNELMRPDCYAILKNGKITSFADSTNKTIRQAHNLEKMMLGGEFEV